MSNNNQFDLKGIGYFIAKVEDKIFQIIKMLYNLSSNYCLDKSKIIISYFINLLKQENLSKMSKSILVFTILYLISKAIYGLVQNNKKFKTSKISIKPEVFFPPKEKNQKMITDSEYKFKIIKKGDNWDNMKILLEQKCKLFKIKENDLENFNEPFFKIVKAFLKYDEIKNKF